MNDSLPDKVNVGGVTLKLVPDGKTPEHYACVYGNKKGGHLARKWQ